MHIPHFVYPFIHPWTFGLFPPLGYCKQWCSGFGCANTLCCYYFPIPLPNSRISLKCIWEKLIYIHCHLFSQHILVTDNQVVRMLGFQLGVLASIGIICCVACIRVTSLLIRVCIAFKAVLQTLFCLTLTHNGCFFHMRNLRIQLW